VEVKNQLRTDLLIRKLKVWFDLMAQMKQGYDPSWNIEAMPSFNISLPPGVGGMVGMSPETIKDPVVRERYRAALAENEAKVKAYNEQVVLRRSIESYQRKLVMDVVIATGLESDDFYDQLKLIMDEASTPDGVTQKITRHWLHGRSSHPDSEQQSVTGSK